MNKRAGIIKAFFIMLGIILFLAIILLIIGIFYFYNYYVFFTFRLCVSDDYLDTNITCEGDLECDTLFKDSLIQEINKLQGFPDFLEKKLDETFSDAIYCENTCRIKEIRGIKESMSRNPLRSCNVNETEITQEIKGKEGLELLDFVRINKDNLKL